MIVKQVRMWIHTGCHHFTEIGQVAGPSCPLGISHVGPARKSYLYDGHVINHLLTELAIFQPR